jgi:hypothetical protein
MLPPDGNFADAVTEIDWDSGWKTADKKTLRRHNFKTSIPHARAIKNGQEQPAAIFFAGQIIVVTAPL